MMPLLVIDVIKSFIILFLHCTIGSLHSSSRELQNDSWHITNNNSHCTTNDEKVHHHQSYLKVFYIAID